MADVSKLDDSFRRANLWRNMDMQYRKRQYERFEGVILKLGLERRKTRMALTRLKNILGVKVDITERLDKEYNREEVEA